MYNNHSTASWVIRCCTRFCAHEYA